MKKPHKPSIDSCPEYEIFQNALQRFEKDVRRAWKIKTAKSEMEEALSDDVPDEILDMDFSREEVITSLVMLCQEVKFGSANKPPRN